MNNNKRLVAVILFAGLICLTGIVFFFGKKKEPPESELKELREKCALRDSVAGLSLNLSGFNYNEVDTIRVKEMNNGNVIDSFFVYADRHSSDSSHKYYSAPVRKTLRLKNAYQFFIKGQKPYLLSNMTMILRGHASTITYDYSCEMYSYNMNGKTMEGGNPVLIKE